VSLGKDVGVSMVPTLRTGDDGIKLLLRLLEALIMQERRVTP
jgi:hypothetical protein